MASRRVTFPLRNPWLYRRVCQRILCVSEAVRQRCQDDGLPQRLLRVVRDGVDAARLRHGDGMRVRADLGIDVACPILLTLASLTECKGHADLLQAAPGILHHFPQTRLLFAGDGDLRADLQQQTQALGLEGHVHFLGLRDDIADLLAAADLLVLPSREEGLGSSIIEAMLAGTPVVGAAAGGIPELLRDGDADAGWLVSPGDPAALASGIVAALADPDERRVRAAAALQRATSDFTVETMVESTITVYREARAER